MNELLYYPGFEIKNEKWLKFALLYLDHIRPIIPYMCKPYDTYFSKTFLKISQETDLIQIERPEHSDTQQAGYKAICDLEGELNYLSRSRHYKQMGTDPLQRWRMTEKQSRYFTLYDGKYDETFFDYCIDEKLGEKTKEGLLLSSDVAEFYMSCLAEAVSMRTGLEMISNTGEHEKSLMRSAYWNKDDIKKELKVAQDELSILVPIDLDQIPLDQIIELRGQSDFIKERKAYIKATKELIELREHGQIDYSMEKKLQANRAIVQLLHQSLNIANDVIQIPLKIIQGAGIAPLIEGALSVTELPKHIKETAHTLETVGTYHHANRYLISLRNLPKYYNPAP